jgi:hypothetical protein
VAGVSPPVELTLARSPWLSGSSGAPAATSPSEVTTLPTSLPSDQDPTYTVDLKFIFKFQAI